MEMSCDGSDCAAASSSSSPSIVLGSPFSFPVLRNFSLRLDTFPQVQCTFLCFELGALKQGLGVKILAPPKSNWTALAAVVPAGPALPAGFLSRVALSPHLLLISFHLYSYPFVHNCTKSWSILLSPPSRLCSCPSANETMSRNTGPSRAAWNPQIFES